MPPPTWLAVLFCCTCLAAVPAARAAPPPPEDAPPRLLVEEFTDLPPTPYEPEPSTEAPETTEPGCAPCRTVSCPRSAASCAAGAGLAPDPCGCCAAGLCGLREGARCYNVSNGDDLAARALGVCGDNMDCLARVDLSEVDTPEALCMCRDRGQVCGSDNTTYTSSCDMRQQAALPDAPPVRVWLKHRGPCRAAPWVVTPPAPAVLAPGSPVSLECEVKGYPAPAPSWERISKEGIATPLPSDDASLVVMVRGGPEAFMASSWLQIMSLRPEDVGTYICVATNSEGVARAATEVTIAV